MDERQFDQLSRRLARFGSRRQAIKAIGAALLATVTGARAAEAQSCTAQYRPCQSDGQCCAGAVCQSGICQPGCKIGGVFVNASTPQPGNTCARCAPAVSTTAWSPANEGMSCWSGNLCGGASTCQSGTCQPTNPVTCQPLTACHLAGECNPNTGLCTNPPAPAGTPCGGGEMCIGGFHTPGLTCNGAGACAGGPTVPCAPYVCGETACRTDCESDAHCATGAVCRQNECIYLRGNGESCSADHYCASGHCVEGVCCDAACEGLCDECGTGTCRPVVCADGLSCSEGVCQPAVCFVGTAGVISDGPWTVCRADAASAWLSSTNIDGGAYDPLVACQSLGYSQVGQYGGTCGDVCGYCQGSVSCSNPGNEFYDGDNACGGGILCYTVQWECLA